MKKIFKDLIFYFVIFIYLILLFSLFPIIIITLILIKDLKSKFIRRIIPVKFKNNKKILVHASSAGEAILAYNLFEDNANYTYFNEGAFQIFKTKNVENNPIPFEFFISIIIFILLNKYSTVIFIEQEIWPAFLFLNKLFNKKLILLNCNMYEKSFETQKKFKFFFNKLFSFFDEVISKSEEDMNKVLQINQHVKIQNLDNFKILSSFKTIKNQNKSDVCNEKSILPKRIILFSSFHQQEFSIFLDVVLSLREKDYFFIIAPRHLDRIKILTEQLEDKGISYELLSDSFYLFDNSKENDVNENNIKKIFQNIIKSNFQKEILIIDKYGFLSDFYKYSSISIIGGSFNNKGGQNFVEAILQKTPVIIGPSYENFLDMVNIFEGPWLNILNNYNNKNELLLLIIEKIEEILAKNHKNIYINIETKILQLKKIAEKQNEYIQNLL